MGSLLTTAASLAAALVLSGTAALACDARSDLTAYYAQDEATVYEYPAAEPVGHGIVGVLGDLFGRTPAATVYVAIDDTDGSAAIFLYDANGCMARPYVDIFDRDALLSLFDALGVQAPFGENFHQTPGVPGGAPGFETGTPA